MFERELVFQATSAGVWLVVRLLAAALTATLIVMLLRYERRLVPHRVGIALLVLRLAVVGLLFVVLLEPVVAWTLDRTRAGRVIVAIDLSDSMATSDRHANDAEKLRWARALELIGNPATNARLDRWMADYEAGREPEWVDEQDGGDDEARRELAEARKASLQAVLDDVSQISRKDIVTRLLSGTTTPLLSQLSEVASVDLRVFAGRAAEIDEQALETTLASPPEGLLAEKSDLARVLQRPASADSAPLAGIVVLTDGRDNSGGDLLKMATRLGEASVPLFPVMVGSELRPRDLSIGELNYPQTASQGDVALLKAKINTSGFEGESLSVVLDRAGAEPVVKTVTAKREESEVEFSLDANDLGRQTYTLHTEVQSGETRTDNNRKSFTVNVVSDQAHVMLLDDEARWEFRFIDNALSRDENVTVDEVVFHQPYIGVLDDTFFPRSLPVPENNEELAESPFAEADLVIVGDVSPGDFPESGWELLEKFVSESGGTLVLLAGKNYMPLRHDSAQLAKLMPLTNLRPAEFQQAALEGSPLNRGFHLSLTDEGQTETMFQLQPGQVANRATWMALPGHTWALFGDPKPGATVFFESIMPGGEKLGRPRESDDAVIVYQHYGAGQVLWIGIDSTWRWRHRAGDTYHHRFWGQLARWAVENKAAVGNEFVRFGPDRNDVRTGDEVIVRARWTQKYARQYPELKARAEVYRSAEPADGKPFSTVDLVPSEGQPLVHVGRLSDLPPDDYRIKLVADNAELGPEELVTPLYVRPEETLELNDLRANRELLTELAGAAGGELLLLDQLDRLPEKFLHTEVSTSTRYEFELWNHWTAMLVFFGLLTAEWVVRKWNGLP